MSKKPGFFAWQKWAIAFCWEKRRKRSSFYGGSLSGEKGVSEAPPTEARFLGKKGDRPDQETGFLGEYWLGDRDSIKKPGFSYPQKSDRPPKNFVRSKDFSLTNPSPSQKRSPTKRYLWGYLPLTAPHS
ncbi:MAG: hypothetical protein F6J93_18750 [Oscillatoria sp. SIO1A7]|nr:hypothetical protein [Oscillatoria sp. SIO1A7]